MGVVGHLEDLAFPDLLQIIHASRRSGTLILSMPGGERRVSFENGLVRSASLGPDAPRLEDLLTRRGLVVPAAIPGARARAARQGISVTAALVSAGAVSQEDIERLVREELESGLRSLVLSQEGEFRFELEEETPHAGSVLLLVERTVVRRALEEALRGAGFRVESLRSPEAALERARALAREGHDFHFVGDLVLPGAAGDGWQGGLDLLRAIVGLAPGNRGILLQDGRSPSSEAAARAAGASACLSVPPLASGDWNGIGRVLAQFGAEVRDRLIDPGGEEPAAPRTLRVVDQLSLLRGLVGELHSEQEVEIPLLVLRLATEYFERGVLFAVHEGRALGTGAFGGEDAESDADGLDRRLRGVALPLVRGSFLENAVRTRAPYVGPLPPGGDNAIFLEKLGGAPPREAAVLPILRGPAVVSLLYGDNGASHRPIGDLRGLEIFTAQAGIALQNSALQRRLTALSGRGGSLPHD